MHRGIVLLHRWRLFSGFLHATKPTSRPVGSVTLFLEFRPRLESSWGTNKQLHKVFLFRIRTALQRAGATRREGRVLHLPRMAASVRDRIP
jgi:hypothetical protein